MKKIDKELPNKLTKLRIILSIIVIVIMLFPFDMINVSIPKYLINGTLIIDLKLVVCAVLFSIADKILVNGLLIILTGQGYISPVIPVIIILRDTITTSFKMIAGEHGDVVGAIKTGKFKAAFLMIGITLKLLGNFPLGLWGIALDDFCLVTATVLALISGIEYYNLYKKYFKN